MYQCRQCKTVQENPIVRKDRFDGEAYRFCRRCGGRTDPALEQCRRCGRELFPEEHAYEIDRDIYCAGCVSEVIL